jgi:hypothetical protein
MLRVAPLGQMVRNIREGNNPLACRRFRTCLRHCTESPRIAAANFYGDPCDLNARMDHAPDSLPPCQVPLTTVCSAFSKRSASRPSVLRSTPAVHVPEYSPSLPETAARQAPVHRVGDFAADHPPLATVLPCASASVHAPVTAPLAESGTALQVPISVRPLLDLALQVPDWFFCTVPDAS